MRITEITDVSGVYKFCKDYFTSAIPEDAVMDYSQTYSFVDKVIDRFQYAVDKQDYANFDIQFMISPPKGGGEIDFKSWDGENIAYAVIQIFMGGYALDGAASRAKLIKHLTSVCTHEIGHAIQFNTRPIKKMFSSGPKSNDEFLAYLAQSFETEMHAVTAVLDLKDIAREQGLTVRDFLQMVARDINTFIGHLKDRTELIGLTNIFVQLRNRPDSKLKSETYKRFLKAMYRYSQSPLAELD